MTRMSFKQTLATWHFFGRRSYPLPRSCVGSIFFGFAVAMCLTSAGGTISPFVAEGNLTRQVFRLGESIPYLKTEAQLYFSYSNGWWQTEIRYLNPEQNHPAVENSMKIPDGVRTYTLFQAATNKG